MTSPISHAAPRVSDAWFAALAAHYVDTAAGHGVPLLIWSDYAGPNSEPVAYRHHDFFSLYFVRRGRGIHHIDGVPYGIARGDVYAMGIGQTHHFSEPDDLVLDTLHFSPDIFDPETLDVLTETRGFQSLFVEEPLTRSQHHGASGRWLHLTPDAYAAVAASLAELRAEWESGTPSGTLLTRGLFVRLLVHLARIYADGRPTTTPAPTAPREATVAAAVRFLDEHFMEPVRIEQVAASVFLSADRFTEVFSRAMGRTPRDYLRHLRVERAKSLLTTTDATVSRVGIQAGFAEPAYFTRVFRAATGMTPSDWRAQRQRLP